MGCSLSLQQVDPSQAPAATAAHAAWGGPRLFCFTRRVVLGLLVMQQSRMERWALGWAVLLAAVLGARLAACSQPAQPQVRLTRTSLPLPCTLQQRDARADVLKGCRFRRQRLPSANPRC